MPAATPQLVRQMVVAIGVHDRALLAGCRDGSLSGALGASGESHDLLAKLGIASLRSQFGHRLTHIGRFDFMPVDWAQGAARRRAGRREPQGGGIELEQALWWRGRVTKLEAEFDGVALHPRLDDGPVYLRWLFAGAA